MTRARPEEMRRTPARGTARRSTGVADDGCDPIIEAAARLFERKGYDEATVEEIAILAGGCRQVIHARYGTKDGILVAIVLEFFRGFGLHVVAWEAERARQAPQGALGPAREPVRIEHLVGALQDYLPRRGAVARVGLASRNLPWLAAATRPARQEMAQIVRYHLPDVPVTTIVVQLVFELLGCVALAGAPGAPAGADGVADQVAAALQELARVLRPSPVNRPLSNVLLRNPDGLL
ncbi:MAG: helix-turn-helix transcriptional regulator [Deltaproteobacteria bacterium]|nr:helix-turn-helix transcriptional regulator [Deltaproteobacteria bacterium]